MSHSQNFISISIPDTDENLLMDLLQIKKAALILRAFNHKLRQQIVKLIDEQTKTTVTNIYVTLRLEQSVASQHLAILRRAGLVKAQREGKFIYYSLEYENLRSLDLFVKNLLDK
ncbi:MAG: metalloregulator ArsR/SmtB family transcription factor [Chitinophagaceae bacterium]|jgi:DNA-binding transcriptional ArsR family regulator|nr:metalloregulator ArsR/SmtB family transcription factor [Chitinophagaceae bacterium]